MVNTLHRSFVLTLGICIAQLLRDCTRHLKCTTTLHTSFSTVSNTNYSSLIK